MCHKTQLEQDCGKQKGQDYHWALIPVEGSWSVPRLGRWESELTHWPVGYYDEGKMLFPLDVSCQVGSALFLATTWLKEKAGQVVMNTQAICAADPLPDL